MQAETRLRLKKARSQLLNCIDRVQHNVTTSILLSNKNLLQRNISVLSFKDTEIVNTHVITGSTRSLKDQKT